MLLVASHIAIMPLVPFCAMAASDLGVGWEGVERLH